jgi:arylsulfatase A
VRVIANGPCLSVKSDKPFMLSVHFYEPHWLLVGPDKLVKKYENHYDENKQLAHYPAAVENVDNEIGRILAKLKEKGLDKNTIIVFTSDNGAAKFGKGRNANRNDGRAAPYKGNKYGLWDGSVHVPGFINWPGVTKPGTIINAPASAVDLLPTFCAIAGVAVPADIKIDGSDITPLLKGKSSIKRKTPLQWHHYNSTLKDKNCPRASLRSGDLLLCGWYDNAKPIGVGRWYPKYMDQIKNQKLVEFKLFDISNDPLQKNDISKSHPEKVQAMIKEITAMHSELQTEAYGWEKEYSDLKKSSKKKKSKKSKKRK